MSFTYLNPINFHTPLIFMKHECAKINSAENRPFFVHLGVEKLMMLKCHFRAEFDGILQYFSLP